MTINASDIKLLESERMADTSDGGGRRTSRVIPDGEPGNIFPKVSRLDSVYGRVNLRKVYGAVQTANVDVYAGAHAAIMDPPDNNRIHVSMFTTASDFDNRSAARDRIESYVVAGPESRMSLFGRQLVGQGAITAAQRVEETLPDVGGVICLSKESGATTAYQQFVRITELTQEVRNFTDEKGDYQRRVLTMTLSSPLRYEFTGPETPSRTSAQGGGDSKIRLTTVADAARYFGIRPLTSAAAQNALQVTVDSVYTPVVPTTQRESALSNAEPPGAISNQNINATVWRQPVKFHGGNIFNPAGILWRGAKPGTVKLMSSGNVVFAEDDGNGNLVGVSPPPSGFPVFSTPPTIDYESGVITGSNSTNQTNSFTYTVEYEPVTNVTGPAHTREVQITISNRGTVYVETLQPVPAPGSLIVEYRALGKWYRLQDNGRGELTADDPSIGVGTVNYVTGAAVVTLGALPDAETSVLFTWGSPVHTALTLNDASTKAYTTLTLPDLPVKTSTLSVSYVNNVGQTITGTANAQGEISGSGISGTLNRMTGEVKVNFTGNYMPQAGSVITANYQQVIPAVPGDAVTATGSFTPVGTSTIPDAPITPGSFTYLTTLSGDTAADYWRASWGGPVAVRDDGNGNLVVAGGQQLPYTSGVATAANTAFASVSQNTIVGTINYTTGQVTISNTTVSVNHPRWAGYIGWIAVTTGFTLSSAPVNYVLQNSGITIAESSKTATFNLDSLGVKLDLTQTTGRSIVPGSILFTLAGWVYVDRDGTLVANPSGTTGSGTSSGTINYQSGVINLTNWNENGGSGPYYNADMQVGGNQNPVGSTLSVRSCLTIYGEFSVTEAFFRTAGSPIRPGSFYVQATTVEGTLISGTTDPNGVISGAKMRGEVVQTVGLARVEFGEYVDGIWTPIGVVPSTIRYNSVVLSNLPLNAEILGLDPVRLPADGQVPIYRPADVVVIHNTKSFTLPNPAVAGATYSMGRTNLADVYLVDAEGDKVPTTQYVVNLAAGTITMAANLNLAGFTQPLVARHRIEELNLLSDVQINGQLSLTGPLTRAYDTDTYVSTALLFGDLSARSTNLFDQGSWTNVWSDMLIGSGATAQYNDIDYPIEVLNNGAVTERWRLNFTSSTAFQVIGENLGVIATGTTSADLTPTNPLTGLPYFTLRAAGWGLGWSAGNQLRFNTLGATAPIWLTRTVLPGATLNGDSFDLQIRGDVDA